MKKALIVAAALFVLVWITPASAQWVQKATADVPFEFMVGDTMLPAGSYAVLMDQKLPNSVMIQNVRTGASAIANHNMILTPANRLEGSTELIFASNGQHHQLHQVVIQRDNHRHDLIHHAEIAELQQTSH